MGNRTQYTCINSLNIHSIYGNDFCIIRVYDPEGIGCSVIGIILSIHISTYIPLPLTNITKIESLTSIPLWRVLIPSNSNVLIDSFWFIWKKKYLILRDHVLKMIPTFSNPAFCIIVHSIQTMQNYHTHRPNSIFRTHYLWYFQRGFIPQLKAVKRPPLNDHFHKSATECMRLRILHGKLQTYSLSLAKFFSLKTVLHVCI